MASFTTDIANSQTIVLPLHQLVVKLRQHGFVIRPEDYIEMLKVVEIFGQGPERIDASRLCPLIATSPEEQERFYKVFEEYEATFVPNETIAIVPRNRWWHRYKWWIIAGVAIVLIGLSFLLFQARQIVSLQGQLVYQKLSAGDTTLRVGDSVEISAEGTLPTSLATDKSLQFFWNTGDGFRPGSKTNRVLLNSESKRRIELKVRSKSYHIKDSVRSILLPVCPAAPNVDFSFNQENYELNDQMVLNVSYGASEQKRFHTTLWKINNEPVASQGDGSLKAKLDSTGTYEIEFFGLLNEGDNEQSPCVYRKRFDNITINDHRYAIQTAASGRPLVAFLTRRLHPVMNWLLLLPAFLIAVGTFLWWNRNRKKKGKKDTDTPPQFTGRKPPYETPFENKDLKLTEPEPEFREIFRSFRQKAEDETTSFNVLQSIRQTIRTGGLPELVFTHKLRYTDYVILIDRTLAKSMQVRLFDYLVRQLNEECINVERFYYSGDFEKIYNEEVPEGYSFQRLTELYKAHTLIIMGHAHQLVYKSYLVLDKKLTGILSEWEYKAILTPVAYKDWGEKEGLISQQFILLPADVQGQLRLMQAIREKTLDQQKYMASVSAFYETASLDFGAISDIQDYLQDDVLFQWLCATAVYHKLRWEVVVEIGKAICTEMGQPGKMNFTSLLKLSRIAWMVNGSFPASIRLDLLKQLTPRNELKARETLLQMLRYADTYFTGDHFFEGEKEVQKTTSRFLLYAHDPQRYAEYEEDQQRFKTLWNSGKVWDTPQKAYLENPEGNWPTLLQTKGRSTGINQYFNWQKVNGLKAERKVLRRNGGIAAGFLLALGMLHFLKNRLPDDSLFIKSAQTNATLNIAVADTILCGNAGPSSSLQGRLQLSNGTDFDLQFNDNLFASVSIPGNLLKDSTGLIELSWNDGQSFTTTTLVKLLSDTMRISLSACTVKPMYTVNIVYNDSSRRAEVQNMASFLTQQGYQVKNITFERFDSTTAVYFFTEKERMAADSLADLLSLQYNGLFSQSQTVMDTSMDFGLKRNLGLLINFNPTAGWKLSQLDRRLNEIWKGEINNRFITISVPMLYYSTGDKRTYGTYRIDEVWSNSNGTTKIITRTNPQYQVFFVRNIQGNSFDLSLCQNRYPSKEEAQAANESACDEFNTMKIYYEKDDAKIFLPLNPNNNLEQANSQKLKKLQNKLAEMNRQQGSSISLVGRIFYNNTFKWQVPNNLPNPIVQTTAIPNETPFDRSYAQYSFNYSPDNKQPNCNKVFYSLGETSKEASPLVICRLNLSGQNLTAIPKQVYQFKNLKELDVRQNPISETEISSFRRLMPNVKVLYDKQGGFQMPERLLTEIQVDEKGNPDRRSQNTLQKIVSYTNAYSDARVRLVLLYENPDDEKTVLGTVSQFKNYVSKLQYRAAAYEFEVKYKMSVRQNNTYRSASENYTVEVYGTNFPSGFLQSASKD